MAIPINIEDLLNKQKIESNRIEFKRGWNPDKIYHTICAFATDLDNTGGGYILVGVEQDENGIAKRPVKGLPIETIDGILQDMVGYDAKITTSNLKSVAYNSRVSKEEVDGECIRVIWVLTGSNRPYCVPESVVAKGKSPSFGDMSSKLDLHLRPADSRLKQLLGQSFVQVKESINQSIINKKDRLEQILEQMFVQVWISQSLSQTSRVFLRQL